jgi:DNA topoisomerase-3
MVGLCEPGDYDPAWKKWTAGALPMLPASFSLRPLAARRKHWLEVRKLLRDSAVTEVVNACDAGREGELIFRYVYEMAGCRKPVQRLWLSSLTEAAIRSAMAGLRPGSDFDALADAARSRSEADWLVGLNATRALTLAARRGGVDRRLMSVGRVQTPTLAMLVDRERSIEGFESRPFWKVFARFDVDSGGYEGVYDGPWPPSSQREDAKESPRPAERDRGVRLATGEEAQEIVGAVRGGAGEVRELDKRVRRERPPLLYDLTSLQREANKRFRLSAAATLAVAQELYERHKLITYPRVDSRHLTRDMVEILPAVIRGVSMGPYAKVGAALLSAPLPISRRTVDDAEVGDHHAIIPTGKTPDLDKLSSNCRRVFDLIVRRLLAAFSADAVFALTTVTTSVEGHRFMTRGRLRLEAGWQAIDPPHRARGDVDLPEIVRGEAAAVVGVRVHEGKTEPPPRFTEGALLGAMERAGAKLDDEELRRAMKESGLGTPATRANIIETLLARQYVAREGKVLVPTPDGKALIDALPVPALKSAALTAQWESRLSAMADGRGGRGPFMDDVRQFAAELVGAIAAAPPPEHLANDAGPALGICPICRTPVRESRRAYVCEKGRDCSFVIFKTVARRKIGVGLAKLLLAGRRSQVLRGFRSKKGKPFPAALRLDADGRVAFCFDGGEEVGPSPAQRPALCPACREGEVVRGRRGWGCSRWRDGCRFVVWFEQFGRVIPDAEADLLFRSGQTRHLDGFVTPEGRRVGGSLVLDLQTSARVRLLAGPVAR